VTSPTSQGGFQARNTPAERRAFFDLDKKLRKLLGKEDLDAAIAAFPTTDGPVTVTTLNGWASYGGGYASPQVYRIGKVVHLAGLFRNGNAAAVTVGQIASVPAWANPNGAFLITGLLPSSTQPTCRLDLTTAGAININALPAVSIPAGQYIAVSTHWRIA
jgi:hypothetical protein